jgi:ribosome-associated protein
VLCSGDSERQVKAIADHINHVLSSRRVFPLSLEGVATSNWILMDFGDVVVHVFRTDARGYYGLEKLWADARRVRIPQTDGPAPSVPMPRARKRSPRVREQG